MQTKAQSFSFPALGWSVILFCAVTITSSPAQSVFFNTLALLNGTIGTSPYDGLVLGRDGNFYATAYAGGNSVVCWQGGSCGTVFKMTPDGALTNLYSFNGLDGAFPVAGLVQASDGNFYGMTEWGGTSSACHNYGLPGCGTVFKITPSGALTTLYSFCSQANCADGFRPTGGLMQAADGNLYGTTSEGGVSNVCQYGCGTVFRITMTGTLTTLHSFTLSDGLAPASTLVQASDGNFYGTAEGGPVYGTVFKMTPAGVVSSLHSFDGTDGEEPNGVVLASDGNLYGTTYYGGLNGNSGTVYKVTLSGAFTLLYGFCSENGCTDGRDPAAALVQAADGNFYGTTIQGGIYTDECYGLGCGTVYQITPAGRLTTIHSFCASGQPCADGSLPYGALVQSANGSLYGTTLYGSTIFRMGLVRRGTRNP